MLLEEVVPSPSFELKSYVVCAGAGTGKTTYLMNQVAFVYKEFKKQNTRPPHLMVCTFTIKATQELKKRLFEKAVDQEDWEFLAYIQSPFLHISTIDSILHSFLRKYGYEYGLNPDFTLEDTHREAALFNTLSETYLFGKYFFILEKMSFSHIQEILRCYIREKLKYGDISFYNEQDFADFQLEYQSRESKGLLSKKLKANIKAEPECFEAKHFIPFFKDLQQLVDEFFEDYLEQKKTQAYLITEDLILLSLDLLRKCPNVAKSFSQEWDYWFIDEYQDTSWAQEQFFTHITQFKNVFCVGDPKQSIYFFRGADPEVFKRRVQAVEKEDKERVETLHTNYRSTSSMVHFFKDFFTPEKGFIDFKPDKKDPSDKSSIYFLTYEKSSGSDYKQIYGQAFESIYCYIQKLLNEGNTLSDITILSRKNQDLINLASFLKDKHINILLYGSSFADNRLIIDALFLFKFLLNPYDNTNLISLLRCPYFYLEDPAITDVCYQHNNQKQKGSFDSLWSCFKKEHIDIPVIQKLNLYLDIVKEKGVLHTFEQALLDRGFLDLSYYNDPLGLSESNLWKLLTLLKNTKNPLSLFYSLIEDETVWDHQREVSSVLSSDAISLMTIHKSKGLEFKNVIICDLSLGSSLTSNLNKECVFDVKRKKIACSIPIGHRSKKKIKSYGHKVIMDHSKKQEQEESQRLFYVAMTRAKETLACMLPCKITDTNLVLFANKFFEFAKRNSKGHIIDWEEGVYNRNGYSFEVKNNFKYSLKSTPSYHSPSLLDPYKPQVKPQNYIKSSKDFYEETQEHTQLDSQKIILPRIKNQILNRHKGIYLHHYLKLLSTHSLKDTLAHLKQSYVSQAHQGQILDALKYVSDLKDPDLSDCLKTGQSEWSFRLKRENIILQGRIDLWSQKNNKDFWVFDYKSGESPVLHKQLIFYSWVLEHIYPIKTINMCEVYPFTKQIQVESYSQHHKQQMEDWLQTLSP